MASGTTLKACAAFEQDLVLYHYGECAPAEKQRLESHLENCAACGGFLQELKSFLPSTVETDDPPPSFWQDYSREMRIKIDEHEQNRGWWPSVAALFRPWPVPALAAVAIVAISVTMTLTKSPEVATNSAPEYTFMASNADFLKSMDLLDSVDFLESVEETQQGEAAGQPL
jgi:Putative zinc-finger